MKNLDNIIKAIEICTSLGSSCLRCPYQGVHDCTTAMERDALEVLKKHRALRAFIRDKKEKAV